MNNTEDKPAMSNKTLAVAVAFSCTCMLGLPAPTNAQTGKQVRSPSSPTKEIQMVAPALEHYTHELLLGDVWKPYQTRHTYASMMLSAGELPMWVAKQMGHKDWTMIARVYGRWMPDADAGAGSRAESVFARARGEPLTRSS